MRHDIQCNSNRHKDTLHTVTRHMTISIWHSAYDTQHNQQNGTQQIETLNPALFHCCAVSLCWMLLFWVTSCSISWCHVKTYHFAGIYGIWKMISINRVGTEEGYVTMYKLQLFTYAVQTCPTLKYIPSLRWKMTKCFFYCWHAIKMPFIPISIVKR